MPTIIIKTSSKREAKEILSKVYEADNAATYCDDMESVSGSFITGQINEDNSVEISSSHYVESSLKEMFE